MSVKSVRQVLGTWLTWPKRRIVIAFLAFLGFCNMAAFKLNINVVIIAMTKNRTVVTHGTSSNEMRFDWDSKMQGYILSAFYYGYVPSQCLCGWICTKIGGKLVFGLGIALTAVLNLLIPWLTHLNVYFLPVVRALVGVFVGVCYPASSILWIKWAPPLERATLVTSVYSGAPLGALVAMPLCGCLADNFGWPTAFYFTGSSAIAWCILWWIYASDSPSEDPRITQAELEYIRESLDIQPSTGKMPCPWKDILCSMPVWTIMFASFCDCWGTYTFVILLPKFLNDVLHFDLSNTGFFSGLPFLAMTAGMWLSGFLADCLLKRKMLTTTAVRKLFTCGCFIASAAFIFLIIYLKESYAIITCTIVAGGLMPFVTSGAGVNNYDIAPQFASVISGISNGFGNLSGILLPLVASYIVTTPTADEWHVVFFITCGFYVVGCTFYGIFGTGDVQKWSVVHEGSVERGVK